MRCCGSTCTARARSGTCFWVLHHEPSWCWELRVWQEPLLCFKGGLRQLRASGAPVALTGPVLTQPCACPNANLLGADPDLSGADQAAARFPDKQPGWLSCGDGHLCSVVPVPGRACAHSWEVHGTGWSRWTWSLAGGALDLIRHIKEKHLCLKESL